MIEEQQATVFYAKTAGKRFFTPDAAIKAEARARIRKHCDHVERWAFDCGCLEAGCRCTYNAWLREENTRKWFRWYDRLCWVLRAKWDVEHGRKPKPYKRKQRRVSTVGEDSLSLDPPDPDLPDGELPF